MAEENNQDPPKKCKKTEGPAGAPAWMITYSDMVTLLLTFFVLLLSMANMDPVRIVAASKSLKDAFGMNKDSANVNFTIPVLPSPPLSQFAPVQTQAIEKVYEKIKSQIDALRLNKNIGVLKKDDNSIILRINDSVLFDRGQSKLYPKSYPLLRNIADLIRPLPMDLRIEGHSDDTPVPGSSIGNWDLSVERAVAVLRYISQSELLSLDRMAAVGYGKERPVASNRDKTGRALNRRVDFVLRLRSNRAQGANPAADSTMPL